MKYLCDPHIIPTNTCPSDLSELSRRTEELARFAQEIQLDIADGVFAPAVSWPYGPGHADEIDRMIADGVPLPQSDAVSYEAHLMVADPLDIGEKLAALGCARILVHVEALSDAHAAEAAFESWRARGVKEIGLSLLIDTPLESADAYVAGCDVVQIMSIAKIGAQGQPFDERALSRVEEFHAMHPDMMVAVDGGVSESNIELLVRAGANRLCVGSAISKSADPASAFAQLHARAMRGCVPVATAQAV